MLYVKRLFVRESHLWIWKHQLDWWLMVEMLPRDGGAGRFHCCALHITCRHRCVSSLEMSQHHPTAVLKLKSFSERGTPPVPGWAWQVWAVLSLSQPKANSPLPFSLTGIGEQEQSQQSPTPDLKLMHVHRQGTLMLHCWSPEAHSVKSFSCCLPETREQAPFLPSPAAYLKTVGVCSPHRGHPLIVCHWWPGVYHSRTPRDCNKWKSVLGRSPAAPPGYCTNSRLKYSPCLLVKKAYLPIRELHLRGQTSGFPHI